MTYGKEEFAAAIHYLILKSERQGRIANAPVLLIHCQAFQKGNEFSGIGGHFSIGFDLYFGVKFIGKASAID